MYRLTASLINSWLRAMDSDALGNEYADFLADLYREKRPTSPAAQAGIDFEDLVHRASVVGDAILGEEPTTELQAALGFGRRVRNGAYQVRGEKQVTIRELPINLVGIADFVKAGIITDIKRVQRYEYGKYQFSAQHPMYLELWPEAMRFDYLIWDGSYAYMEQYRRGDCDSILSIGAGFLKYLDDADLIDVYKTKWEEKK